MDESETNAPQGQDNTASHSNTSQDSGPLSNISTPKASDPPPPPEGQRAHCGHEPPPQWRKNPQFIMEICVFAVGLYVAYIYSGQLTQMQIATEASTKAANLAAGALDENRGQFERMMSQVIHQTASQAIAANGSMEGAGAAKSAANTAQATLHISERAYLVDGTPQIDSSNKGIGIPIINKGHVPSGAVTITAYEATTILDVPSDKGGMIESHCNIVPHHSIAPDLPLTVTVKTPEFDINKWNAGEQGVIVVGFIDYNDGFPGTPQQRWRFCDELSYDRTLKHTLTSPCGGDTYLPFLQKMICGVQKEP